MQIHCNECGNTKHFALIREVELRFDYKQGIWDAERPIFGERNVICRSCGADQSSGDVVVVEE